MKKPLIPSDKIPILDAIALAFFENIKAAIWRAFLREVPKLSDLGQLWAASTLTNQLELVRHFFPGGLSIDRQGLYSRLNPALLFDNSRKFNNLQVKKDGITSEKTEIIPIVPGMGTGLNPGNVRKLVTCCKNADDGRNTRISFFR